MDAVNSEIMDQIRKFNENFEKLQSELTVAKQVNSLLSERLNSMDRQCWEKPNTLNVSLVALSREITLSLVIR